jgi:acetyl esterase/lipase
MIWIRRIVKAVVALLLLAVVGGGAYALIVGRPPARRPELVTPLPEGVPAPPRGYPSEITAFASAYLLHDLIPWEDAPAVDGVVETLDVQFGTGGGEPLYLDLYQPPALEAPAPGLVLYYGGGWTRGRKDQLRTYAQFLAQHGYVVATAQYRLKKAGQWPNSIHDAKCAVRWMRAHAAQYKVDPARIGVMGNSAGAYLALMVGYTAGDPFFEGEGGWADQSSAVQAVIDIYGPVDFTEPVRRDHPLILRYMNGWYENDPAHFENGRHENDPVHFENGRYEDDPARFEKASPIRYVTPKTPPTCVIHGTVDMLVPVHQSDWLVEKLRDQGVPHLYSRLDGWPHAMDFVADVHAHTRALALYFFDQHLKPAA